MVKWECMKYISIDTETTGLLDVPDANVWQIAGVVEDTDRPDVPIDDLPSFNFYVTYPGHDGFYWTNGALKMNIKNFTEYLNFSPSDGNPASYQSINNNYFDGKYDNDVIAEFLRVFVEHHFGNDKVVFAGKNVSSFDIPFCKQCGLFPRYMKATVRTLDPSLGYIIPSDKVPPSLDMCIERIPAEYKESQFCEKLENSHDALEDARCVILAMRYLKSIGKVGF